MHRGAQDMHRGCSGICAGGAQGSLSTPCAYLVHTLCIPCAHPVLTLHTCEILVHRSLNLNRGSRPLYIYTLNTSQGFHQKITRIFPGCLHIVCRWCAQELLRVCAGCTGLPVQTLCSSCAHLVLTLCKHTE